MKLLKELINYTNLLFAIVGFGAIAFFINLKTAMFLFFFLLEIGLFTYALINMYGYFSSKKEKIFLRNILILTFFGLIVGSLLYFIYGTYALIKALSLAALIFLIILGYNKMIK